MKMNDFYEVDGCIDFIPVKLIKEHKHINLLEVKVMGSGSRTFAPSIYKFPKVNEQKKPKVSQVAVEFYEKYKADILSLDEWFSDFYSDEAIEDFPRMEELTDWLHGNDNETNRQRELALATLVTLGIDAVEIEQEKLYTVEIPNPNSKSYMNVLKRVVDGIIVATMCRPNTSYFKHKEFQFTESEIKQDFEWAFQFAKPVEEK